MSTEEIKIEIKEEPLFEVEVIGENSECKTIIKGELDSKLIKKDICSNSHSIKWDFFVKDEELDSPLDFETTDIEVSSFHI